MSRAIQIDTKTFIRFWLIMIVVGVAVLLFSQALTGLMLVGAGLFFALALWPLVHKVDRIFGKKSHLGLSAGLVVTGVALVILAAFMIVGPAVVSETSKFVSTAPEQVQDTISKWDGINQIGNAFGISNAKEQVIGYIKSFSSDFLASIPRTVFSSIGAVANFLTGAVIVVVLTILFLTQGTALMDSFWRKVGTRNGAIAAEARRITSKLANVVARYVTGQVLVAVLDGIVAGVAVFILSLIFGFSSGLALPMGIMAFIFYLIPMFGPIITAVLVSVILFFSDPFAALSFIIFYIVYEQIENNVIAPKVQGNSMSLPPLVILISIVIGMYMFGLVGAIISIPIAGCIKVLIDEYPKIKALKESNS